MCYPSATPEQLLAICKWNHYCFFMYDKFASPHLAASPENAHAEFGPLRKIIQGHSSTLPVGIMKTLNDLLHELVPTMSDWFAARFLVDLDSMLDGFLDETEMRAARHIDAGQPEELIDVRMNGSRNDLVL